MSPLAAWAASLRDVLVPALLGAAACLAMLLAVVVAQRLLRDLTRRRRARARSRWQPVVQAAVHGIGPARERALAELRRAGRRRRAVVADCLLEPLRVVQGSAVDRARAVADELGLTTAWRGALGRGTWRSRSAAALALGLVQDRRAVPALIVMLDEPHHEVRAAAVDALGMIGDVAAVQALVARVGQQSRHQQARLVEALRRIGPAVTSSIVSLDADQSADRRLMADVLAMVGGTGARVTLLEWTGDPDAAVRAAAWRALGTIGVDERSAYHALRALGDGDPRVRAHAARALGRTGRADVVPYLAQHLDDEWEVAAQGARALARLGPVGHAALEAREASGASGHGLELARHFLWEERRA